MTRPAGASPARAPDVRWMAAGVAFCALLTVSAQPAAATPVRAAGMPADRSAVGGQGPIRVDPGSVELTVRAGQKQQRSVAVRNTGSVDVTWRARDGEGRAGRRTAGEVLRSWSADGPVISRGIGVESGNVWVSDADLLRNDSFTVDGVRRDEGWPTSWASQYPGPADMAYVPARGLMCQVKIGADNGVYCWNPRTGDITASIVGEFAWSAVSQRGLAYRPDDDSFYVGGDQGVIYHIAGLGHPEPGRVMGRCTPADRAVAGLGWSSGFGLLWVATNSARDLIHAVDPDTCATVTTMEPPDQQPFTGAGLDVDVDGNLWLMSAGSPGTAYLVDSGVPNVRDVPWLTVTPASGVLTPGARQRLTVQVDATGLAPGRYRATVYVLGDGGSLTAVPVRVLVRPAGRG